MLYYESCYAHGLFFYRVGCLVDGFGKGGQLLAKQVGTLISQLGVVDFEKCTLG